MQLYDSQSAAYHDAFDAFLRHTDQKQRAREWIEGFLSKLPGREVLIDAGAGNGQVTAWYVDQFSRTIAVEPNPHLARDLAIACPKAQHLPQPILAARPEALADWVLCSHVFYYLPPETWLAHLQQLVSWLAPHGALVIILQHHQSDCMQMLDHFFGRRFHLQRLADEFLPLCPGDFSVQVEKIPARIETADLPTAYIIAEFMLNLLTHAEPGAEPQLPAGLTSPSRAAVEDYLQREFAQPSGGYRFSCDQDCLVVRRSGEGSA